MRNIKMPKMGLNMEEGTVIKWLITEGLPFQKGDALCEIESDKTTSELIADFPGTIIEIIVKADESAPVGSVIAVAEEI